MYSAPIRSQKKYSSFLISILLHGLIILLAFFPRFQHNDRQTSIPRTPAQVRWSTPLTVSTPQPQSSSIQQTLATPPSISQPLDKVGVEPHLQEYRLDESRPDEKSSTPDTENVSVSTSSKQTLTKASFMDSFKAATQEIRQEQQRSTASSPQTSQAAFVEKEQKMWSQLHFKQKIIEAIGRASRFRSRAIHYSESVNRVAQLTVPILKDGTLGDLSQYPFSGIQEVDRYIYDILKSADFPPIPKRFNTELFLFTIPINLSIQKGSNVYYLSVQ